MQWFADHWEVIAVAGSAIVGNLIAIGVIIAKLTPSTTDDEWLAKIQDIFNKLPKPKQ